MKAARGGAATAGTSADNRLGDTAAAAGTSAGNRLGTRRCRKGHDPTRARRHSHTTLVVMNFFERMGTVYALDIDAPGPEEVMPHRIAQLQHMRQAASLARKAIHGLPPEADFKVSHVVSSISMMDRWVTRRRCDFTAHLIGIDAYNALRPDIMILWMDAAVPCCTASLIIELHGVVLSDEASLLISSFTHDTVSLFLRNCQHINNLGAFGTVVDRPRVTRLFMHLGDIADMELCDVGTLCRIVVDDRIEHFSIFYDGSRPFGATAPVVWDLPAVTTFIFRGYLGDIGNHLTGMPNVGKVHLAVSDKRFQLSPDTVHELVEQVVDAAPGLAILSVDVLDQTTVQTQ